MRLEVRAERTYTVKVHCDWLTELAPYLRDRSRVAVVASQSICTQVRALLPKNLGVSLLEIPDGEEGKSLLTLEALWNSFAKAGLTRNDLIVAIGGGATTDVVGFAASTWLRGLDWIAVPTTLAGMVDASVGGKTGMNSSAGKNLIGAFHSPIEVLADLSWLQTLSDRDFSAGLAEVIKCGFISDPDILTLVTSNSLADLRGSDDVTTQLIARSVKVKSDVVSADFKESFAREILNYGHTLGHAIELHSGFTLRHGEAVAIGMVYVAELSASRGLISKELVEQHRRILQSYGLPTTYKKSAWPQLLASMALDKKARGSAIRFVALTGIGSTTRLEDLNEDELLGAYERISV